MDIHSIRHLLKMKSIYDIPLRVTYYARVSSESDEQLNSLGNQITYYEDLIRKNRNWTFVPGYIDEGLSGISTKKRENFNRMIQDALDGKIDLIVNSPIGQDSVSDDSYLRKAAIKYKIPYMTTIAAAKATADGILYVQKHGNGEVQSLQELHAQIKDK